MCLLVILLLHPLKLLDPTLILQMDLLTQLLIKLVLTRDDPLHIILDLPLR